MQGGGNTIGYLSDQIRDEKPGCYIREFVADQFKISFETHDCSILGKYVSPRARYVVSLAWTRNDLR